MLFDDKALAGNDDGLLYLLDFSGSSPMIRLVGTAVNMENAKQNQLLFFMLIDEFYWSSTTAWCLNDSKFFVCKLSGPCHMDPVGDVDQIQVI